VFPCARINERLTEDGTQTTDTTLGLICKTSLSVTHDESFIRSTDPGYVRPDRWAEFGLGCQAAAAAVEWKRWRFAQGIEEVERQGEFQWQDDGDGPAYKTL